MQTLERTRSVAVFALAMPAIGWRGRPQRHADFALTGTAINLGIIGSILLIALAFMLMAKPILALLCDAGLNVPGRVAALPLAAVAVDAVLVALSRFFEISGISAKGIL